MNRFTHLFVLLCLLFGVAAASAQDSVELTIATVNNPDMIVMEGFTEVFEEANPGITLNWVVLPENELRATVTTDIATGSSTFDIITIGMFEVPLWARNGWLNSIDALAAANPDNVQADYDFEDLLPGVVKGLSYEGELYSLPFYGESSMMMYNTAKFEAAGLEMPEQPTWDEIREFACALHDPDNGNYGIALRGLPGWGEIMAPLTTVVNTYGGRWFNMDWQPQLDSPEWNEAVGFYVNLINDCGQPGATGTGFTEALTLMAQGQAAMWVDATVAAGFLSNPEQSQIVDSAGLRAGAGRSCRQGQSLALGLVAGHPRHHRSYCGSPAVHHLGHQQGLHPTGRRDQWLGHHPARHPYLDLRNQAYLDAAPFAPTVLGLMESADPTDSTRDPVPYVGVQFAGIPEFQGIGTDVSQLIAEALAGDVSVADALAQANELTREAMEEAGYYD